MAAVKSSGDLNLRYRHLRHKLTVGGLSDELSLNPPKPDGPAFQIAERYSAGRKISRTVMNPRASSSALKGGVAEELGDTKLNNGQK